MCTFPGCEKRFSEKGNMKTHFKTHVKSTKKNFVYPDMMERLDSSIKSSPEMTVVPESKPVVPENKPIILIINDNKSIVHCEQYTYIGTKSKRAIAAEKLAIKNKATKNYEYTIDNKDSSTRCDVTENMIKSPTHDNNPSPVIIYHPEPSNFNNYSILPSDKKSNFSHPMTIFIPEEVYDFPQIYEKNPMEKLYEDNYLFFKGCPVIRRDSNVLPRYDTLFEN